MRLILIWVFGCVISLPHYCTSIVVNYSMKTQYENSVWKLSMKTRPKGQMRMILIRIKRLTFPAIHETYTTSSLK